MNATPRSCAFRERLYGLSMEVRRGRLRANCGWYDKPTKADGFSCAWDRYVVAVGGLEPPTKGL